MKWPRSTRARFNGFDTFINWRSLSLVYPGASHRRFEHSLGVMELAGRVFDILTHERNRHPDVDLFAFLSEQVELGV